MKALLLGAMLTAGWCATASAGQCENDDQITFSFSNLEVKMLKIEGSVLQVSQR
jgi:hypothetical protein